MTVFVKSLTGLKLRLLVEPAMTVADAKLEIYDQEGPFAPAHQQRLSFDDEWLEKDRTLASYDVVDQDEVLLVVCRRGR